MIISIRKHIKGIVATLLFIFLQTYSVEVYALTSGPAQEEYASFEPVGTTDMVNLYTGDFTYNIPLLSVPGPNGGYPINLAYHSGIGMDQEASWVGLGWNVNVGAINRNLRGLPDDFDGDEVTYEQHMRKSETLGLNILQKGGEWFGFGGSSGPIQVYHNNYKGVGYRVNYGVNTDGPVNLGLSLSYDPHEGIGIGASLNLGAMSKKGVGVSLGVSGNWNSRQGVQGAGVSTSIGRATQNSKRVNEKTIKGSISVTGLSGGASFGFQQGVPGVTMPMKNDWYSTSIKMGFKIDNLPGGGVFRTNFPMDWTGTYSTSEVQGNGVTTAKAYGYMNTEHANGQDIKDFSYTPIAYHRKLPDLSPSNVTYDVFGITGQGTGGTFRGHRADVGIFSQRNVSSFTNQYKLGLEVGFASGAPGSCTLGNYQIGYGAIPPQIGVSEDYTGAWRSGYGSATTLRDFEAMEDKTHTYDTEVKFYKDMGDRPAILGTSSMLDAWKGDAAIALKLNYNTNPAINIAGITNNVNTGARDFSERTQRTPRTRIIQAFSKEEAIQYNQTKNYKYYGLDGNLRQKYQDSNVSNINAHHQGHHTSEVSIVEPDGMRYTYGMPAYNLSQEDASFSVQKTNFTGVPAPTVTTPSGPGYFNVPNNTTSKHPEFLDKKNLPAYAHTWMLTSVVSTDYVDVTGDGVSADDLGYWVDFRYQKTSGDYHWRVPYENSNYMPGTSQDFDDKGSYSKGVKELFYLKEVRTKTHIAIYDLEDRNDALGASTATNGGKPNPTSEDRMKQLKSIRLYTIDEYENNPNAEPLKTVHFIYANDTDALCKNVPNQAVVGGGKLTLKEVFFTYGKSEKGRLSPYKFNYSEHSSTHNPDYSLQHYDCWGNYQNNDLQNYPYHEFPYTDQKPDEAYIAPWHLTSIELPTGGTLNIEYEQDDYAYVEDQKAMQLYDIVHTGKGFDNLNSTQFSQRGTDAVNAHTTSLRNDQQNNAGTVITPDFEYRVYFPLKETVSTTGTNIIALNKWFKDTYVGHTKDLYFKTATRLINYDQGNPVGRYAEGMDFISGYAELRKDATGTYCGVAQSPSKRGTASYDIGYITVKPTLIKSSAIAEDLIHPFRDAAFQHLKHARPELVFGPRNVNDFEQLFNVLPDVLTTIMGYKAAFKLEGHCQDIFLDGFSQMRLLVPDGKKLGGGVRVKKLTITDNWSDMTNTGTYQDSEYGQLYDYSIEEEGKIISSGVAYEPYAGKEQNPLVTPIRYENSDFTQNPNNLFLENPIMMRHYPGASVGYRKVTVKSLTSLDEDTKESRAPYTEYEFYSPKDFPIQVFKTEPEKAGQRYTIVPIPGIYNEYRQYEGMSQGYTIIFNDMAGKMKSVRQKTHDDATDNYPAVEISSQIYEYYTQADGSLDNEVDVFVADGTYEKAKLGVDYDIHVDMNENTQSADNYYVDLNFIGGVLPHCIPLPIPTSGMSTTSSTLKTACVQKFIYKSGILKSTTVTNLQSTITTENLVFDKMTGEPLLTRTQNEFHDDIYAYNQKAYWAYDGMAEAFKNTGAVLKGSYAYNVPVNVGEIGTYTVNGMGSLSTYPLVEGDEVYLEGTGPSPGIKATVFSMEGTGNNTRNIGFADHNGLVIDSTYFTTINTITVLRSGRRNLLTAPAGAIAAMDLDYVSNTNIGDSHNLKLDASSHILNASAVTYRDYWPTHKGCEVEKYCSESVCIPFESKDVVNIANFTAAINSGSATFTLNGEPLAPSEITITANCIPPTRSMKFCTRSIDEDYFVVYMQDNGGGIPIRVEPTFRTVPNPMCRDTNMGQFIIPCKPLQSDRKLRHRKDQIRVNGQVWPLSSIKTIKHCEYGSGVWYLKIAEGEDRIGGSHSQIDFNCFLGTGNLDEIEYSYDYNGPNADSVPWGIDHAWSYIDPTDPAGADLYELADAMTNATGGNVGGYNWFVDQWVTRAYVPIDISNDLAQYATLGLRAYYRNPDGVLYPTCYPWYSRYPNPHRPALKYYYKGRRIVFHGYEVRALPPGIVDVVYERLDNNGNIIDTISGFYNQTITAQTIPFIQTEIDLPVNTTGTLYIFNSDTTQSDVIGITNSVQILRNALEVTVNRIPVGVNTLTVSYDHDGNVNTANITRNFTVTCDASDANSSVLLCADGGKLSTGSDTYDVYQKGTKGRWRPWASYTYVGKRFYGDTSNPNPSIREKGVFVDYTPFQWNHNTNSPEWQWAARGTKYAVDGHEVETVDALGNYSAALYDYNDNLATAVAKNARYNEILFDGFENYPKGCNSHAYLTDGTTVETTISHTGKYSYRIDPNDTVSLEPISLGGGHEQACADELEAMGYSKKDVLDFLLKGKETDGMNIPKLFRTATAVNDSRLAHALPVECGCLGRFAPEKGEKYHFSAWVMQALPIHDVVHYDKLTIKVHFQDANGNLVAGSATLFPEGAMIEKWQRVVGDVVIPNDAVQMVLTINNGNVVRTFLDDLRISPFESSMATYVYDKTTLRNTATLDDNNFATFYIYDEEGKLIKTKKETPEGIKTINEGRQHIRGPIPIQ